MTTVLWCDLLVNAEKGREADTSGLVMPLQSQRLPTSEKSKPGELPGGEGSVNLGVEVPDFWKGAFRSVGAL